MRSMESPIKMEQFKELGCNPVPIDFGELYNALQQNTVDGQENPLATIVPSKFYEVQDYMLLSYHAYLAQLVLVSNAWFESLDEEAQQIVDATAGVYNVAKNVIDPELIEAVVDACKK